MVLFELWSHFELIKKPGKNHNERAPGQMRSPYKNYLLNFKETP